MERTKKTKLYYQDTRSKIESTKEERKSTSLHPFEKQKESQMSNGNHDPMDVDSTSGSHQIKDHEQK